MSDDARHERGVRTFAEVMTFDPPEGQGPFTRGLIDFVFGEVW